MCDRAILSNFFKFHVSASKREQVEIPRLQGKRATQKSLPIEMRELHQIDPISIRSKCSTQTSSVDACIDQPANDNDSPSSDSVAERACWIRQP